MPTLNDILTERITRIENVPLKFITSVELTQRQQFKDCLRLLNELEKDLSGNIILSETNLSKIEAMTRGLEDAIYSAQYQDALVDYAKEFNTQGQVNNEYFKKAFKNFTVKELYTKVLSNSQSQAVELLDLGTISQEVITPLKALISDSLGKPFSNLVINMRNFLEGTEEFEGQLTRYTKTIAYDSFANTDANYMNTIAIDLDINTFRYQGSLIEDSREFCIARVGKVYKREQIAQWGDPNYTGEGFNGKGSWQGRNRNTNQNTIFTYRGGYNCKHVLAPQKDTE